MTDPGTDFERRVTEALESGAEEAPDATGLVVAARRRARVRRRARGGVLAGLVVVALAVPVGVVALGGGSPADRGDVATDPSTSAPAEPEPSVPAGWQVERWQGLEVAVPGDWTPGTRSSWCAGDDPATVGRIDRPDGGGGVDIGCLDPSLSFGLTLGPRAAFDAAYESGHVWKYVVGKDPDTVQVDVSNVYVPGSWLGYWYDDTRLVQVNAGDRETVQQVLDSISVRNDCVVACG
jgi:hypothetical protein